MNHIYFGLYYPFKKFDDIVNSVIKKQMQNKKSMGFNKTDYFERSEKNLAQLSISSDFFNKQIVNLIIGITMYLPVAIILITLLRPYLIINKNMGIAILVIWFFLYWYIGHTIFFKNNRRDRYSEQFSKDSKRKNWLWALASYLIVALVWVITVTLYKLINNGTQ